MSYLISVQLDALAVLLGELTALGAHVQHEGELSTSSGRSLGTALGGVAGDEAAASGAAGARMLTALAARTVTVAATLDSALAEYRTADTVLAERIGPGRRGQVAVAR